MFKEFDEMHHEGTNLDHFDYALLRWSLKELGHQEEDEAFEGMGTVKLQPFFDHTNTIAHDFKVLASLLKPGQLRQFELGSESDNLFIGIEIKIQLIEREYGAINMYTRILLNDLRVGIKRGFKNLNVGLKPFFKDMDIDCTYIHCPYTL